MSLKIKQNGQWVPLNTNEGYATKEELNSVSDRPELFVVTRGSGGSATATYSDIVTAISDGKIPIAVFDSRVYSFSKFSGNRAYFTVADTAGNSVWVFSVGTSGNIINQNYTYNYTLPTASDTTLGGIKVGDGLSITDGVLSVVGGGGEEGGSVSNDLFIVTFTNPQNGAPTVDKTNAEIYEALTQNKIVLGKLSSQYSLSYSVEDETYCEFYFPLLQTYTNSSTDWNTASITMASTTFVIDEGVIESFTTFSSTSSFAKKTNVLEKTNTTEYTPTEDYHPATKKYIDNMVAPNGRQAILPISRCSEVGEAIELVNSASTGKFSTVRIHLDKITDSYNNYAFYLDIDGTGLPMHPNVDFYYDGKSSLSNSLYSYDVPAKGSLIAIGKDDYDIAMVWGEMSWRANLSRVDAYGRVEVTQYITARYDQLKDSTADWSNGNERDLSYIKNKPFGVVKAEEWWVEYNSSLSAGSKYIYDCNYSAGGMMMGGIEGLVIDENCIFHIGDHVMTYRDTLTGGILRFVEESGDVKAYVNASSQVVDNYYPAKSILIEYYTRDEEDNYNGMDIYVEKVKLLEPDNINVDAWKEVLLDGAGGSSVTIRTWTSADIT